MSTPENTFISSVHRHLPVDLYRMKNHNQYNGGIPDVWYSGLKDDLWVEYKFIVLPKKNDTVVRIDLSHLQQEWITARLKEGRNLAVIVGSKDGGVWLPGLAWVSPLKTATFRDTMLTRAELASRILGCVQ